MTLASGGKDNKIRLWDIRTGETLQILRGHRGDVTTVVFSPDGLTLASGSGATETRDTTIRLWDTRTGESIQTLEGHTGQVTAVAFSPDGLTLASAGNEDRIRLWDVGTGEHLQPLEGHLGWSTVYCVAFSIDGLTLASGSKDIGLIDFCTIRLWDVRTGEHLRTLEGHTSSIHSVVFSTDGLTLASGSSDGTILLWDVTPYTNPVEFTATDVNKDGITNILDLVLVAAHFGQLGGDGADINGDGVVNLQDLELVANEFGNAEASPASRASGFGTFTAGDIRKWLADANRLEGTEATVQRGIVVL